MGSIFKTPRGKKPLPLKQNFPMPKKKEYEQIESKIAAVEEEIRRLNRLLEDASLAQDPAKLQQLCTTIGLEEVKLEQLFIRWEELDKKLRSE
jgi:hypothetical protein